MRRLRLNVRGTTALTQPNARRVRFAQLTPWSLYDAPEMERILSWLPEPESASG